MSEESKKYFRLEAREASKAITQELAKNFPSEMYINEKFSILKRGLEQMFAFDEEEEKAEQVRKDLTSVQPMTAPLSEEGEKIFQTVDGKEAEGEEIFEGVSKVSEKVNDRENQVCLSFKHKPPFLSNRDIFFVKEHRKDNILTLEDMEGNETTDMEDALFFLEEKGIKGLITEGVAPTLYLYREGLGDDSKVALPEIFELEVDDDLSYECHTKIVKEMNMVLYFKRMALK